MTLRCCFSHSEHEAIPVSRSECVKRSDFSRQNSMLNLDYAENTQAYRGRVKFSWPAPAIRATFLTQHKIRKYWPAKNIDNCFYFDGLKRNFVLAGEHA